MALSADGARLAVCACGLCARVGTVWMQVGGEDGLVHLFDVAAGGALAAAGVSDKNMSACACACGERRVSTTRVCRRVAGAVTAVGYSPAGDRLAAGDAAREARLPHRPLGWCALR